MLTKITRQLLPLLLVLGFTACNERQPSVQRTMVSNISSTTSTPTAEEEVYVEALKEAQVMPISIPILDDEVIGTKAKTSSKPSTSASQAFTGGTVSDGLDIGTIRLGLNNGTTRLVFDSYKWDMNVKTPTVKAENSGHYDFKYDAQNKRITAVISGYRGFSALNATKPRFFRTSNMVEKIYLETYLDDSGYKFTIQLKQNAQVNIFELKEPARIIVDITAK